MVEDSKELKVSENWSWGKFFKGFFDGKNYAKAVVQMFCMCIILFIAFSVVSVIKNRFMKQAPAQTQTVGTNEGFISTTNDTSQTTVNHYHLPLSDLFNWFGSTKNKESK